jgi:integrase
MHSRSTRASPFVLDVVEEFLRTKEARRPKTYDSYRGILLGSERGTKPALGIPLAPFFQNRRIATVRPDEVTSWFGQRTRLGAQDTKHRISKAARSFFAFATQRGYVRLDLAGAIDIYRPSGPRLDWLAWEDIHRLLGAIPEERYRLASAWLFFTGCRVAEACAAQQKDVQWRTEAGMFEWSIVDTKTHAPRRVWLPNHLKARLETTRKANRPRPQWPILWDCEGRGFARIENPSAPISPRTINAALERARETIGLPVSVSAHIAKHSYCTNWIQDYGSSELSMEKLSRQVGTSVSVLRSTYVHIDLTDEDWAHLRSFGERAG